MIRVTYVCAHAFSHVLEEQVVLLQISQCLSCCPSQLVDLTLCVVLGCCERLIQLDRRWHQRQPLADLVSIVIEFSGQSNQARPGLTNHIQIFCDFAQDRTKPALNQLPDVILHVKILELLSLLDKLFPHCGICWSHGVFRHDLKLYRIY